jgi:hypothetical protein
MDISGVDVYRVLPGGHWIAHEVDVQVGLDVVLVHEIVGGVHPEGGWHMYAFDGEARPGLMRLSQEEPDLLLLHGDGVRSWLRIRDGKDTMSSRWERLGAGGWVPWMDMRFDRV